MKDYVLARSGFPLTYLGSLPVRKGGIHKPSGHSTGRGPGFIQNITKGGQNIKKPSIWFMDDP